MSCKRKWNQWTCSLQSLGQGLHQLLSQVQPKGSRYLEQWNEMPTPKWQSTWVTWPFWDPFEVLSSGHHVSTNEFDGHCASFTRRSGHKLTSGLIKGRPCHENNIYIYIYLCVWCLCFYFCLYVYVSDWMWLVLIQVHISTLSMLRTICITLHNIVCTRFTVTGIGPLFLSEFTTSHFVEVPSRLSKESGICMGLNITIVLGVQSYGSYDVQSTKRLRTVYRWKRATESIWYGIANQAIHSAALTCGMAPDATQATQRITTNQDDSNGSKSSDIVGTWFNTTWFNLCRKSMTNSKDEIVTIETLCLRADLCDWPPSQRAHRRQSKDPRHAPANPRGRPWRIILRPHSISQHYHSLLLALPIIFLMSLQRTWLVCMYHACVMHVSCMCHPKSIYLTRDVRMQNAAPAANDMKPNRTLPSKMQRNLDPRLDIRWSKHLMEKPGEARSRLFGQEPIERHFPGHENDAQHSGSTDFLSHCFQHHCFHFHMKLLHLLPRSHSSHLSCRQSGPRSMFCLVGSWCSFHLDIRSWCGEVVWEKVASHDCAANCRKLPQYRWSLATLWNCSENSCDT